MERRAWMIDEAETAGRENLDLEHVARYDSKEPADFEPEIAVLRAHGLTSTWMVADVGAGTGQFTSAIAPHVSHVIAADVSPPMLARLHERATSEHLANATVCRSGFIDLDLPVDTVDLFSSRLALHHLPDFWKSIAFHRITQRLRPGGVFRLVDVAYRFEPADAIERLEQWCTTGRDVPAGEPVEDGWGRWELEEHGGVEHSTYTWIIEASAERSGLESIEKSYDEPSLMASYVFRRA